MSYKVPETMRAVVIDEWRGKPYVKQIPVPKPKSGEVLIKVMASPIHPADNAFLIGQYSTKRKPPTVPGTEGSGLVVKNGGGIVGWNLLGKHVCFIAKDKVQGAWAEYCVADANQCGIQDNKTPYEVTCNGITNPMSVILMLELTQKEEHKAVIVTAACSSIGRQISKHFTAHGIQVINVVRRPEQEQILREQDGSKYILNSESSDFELKLKPLCKELKATCLWDVVSGKLTGRILKCMPKDSVAYIYGALSLDNCQIDAKELIFNRKRIEGFWLKTYIKPKNLLWRVRRASELKTILKTTLATHVSRQYPLEQVPEAVEFYKKNMSLGKVLIKPHDLSLAQDDKKDEQNSNKQQIQNSVTSVNQTHALIQTKIPLGKL